MVTKLLSRIFYLDFINLTLIFRKIQLCKMLKLMPDPDDESASNYETIFS